MNKNPRIVADLAEEFKCKPEDIIGYTPTPEVMSRNCETCRYFSGYNTCDIGDGKPVKTTADTHSCGLYIQENRVCTCGPGYFCTFECKSCDAFKDSDNRKEQNNV